LRLYNDNRVTSPGGGKPSAWPSAFSISLSAHWQSEGVHFALGQVPPTLAKRHAAVVAARTHPRWMAELERLEPRLGYQRAIVAIARKLLVAVWHVLTKGEADVHADPAWVAASLFALAYRMRVKNLPHAMSAKAYTRYHLDRMGIGAELTHIPWGSKRVALPPSEIEE
jgi:hypothetical protein